METNSLSTYDLKGLHLYTKPTRSNPNFTSVYVDSKDDLHGRNHLSYILFWTHLLDRREKYEF